MRQQQLNNWTWKQELRLWGWTALAHVLDLDSLWRKAKGLSKEKLERLKMTRSLWIEVMKRDNFTCKYCHVSLTKGMQVDHIYPVSKGGKTIMSNLQVLCGRCNRRKGNKIL